MITLERLQEVIDYNKETGELTWKFWQGDSTKIKRHNSTRGGKSAGCLDNGQLLVKVDKVRYPAGELAWMLLQRLDKPVRVIHLNGIISDNRAKNLAAFKRIRTYAKEASVENLWNIFDPDFDNGKLFWKKRELRVGCEKTDKSWNSRCAGKEAGNFLNGYRYATVLGRNYGVHRILWAMHYGSWPKKQIDHKNGNPSDNRISNLREATVTDNARNKKKMSNSQAHIIGVRWCKVKKKWIAYITLSRKYVHLGTFTQRELAISARKEAEVNHFGQFSPILSRSQMHQGAIGSDERIQTLPGSE